MPKNERWGDPHQDKRDWKEYNEKLVRRGEFYLSLEFLDSWNDTLNQMNQGKRGRPFIYPVNFIQWASVIHCIFALPFRQMEGFLRKLSAFVLRDLAADYTTLFRRTSQFSFVLADTIMQSSDDVVVAVDSTGVKVTNRGEWMREKWRVHRGWIKVHVVVDTQTKEILSIEVTNETVTDDKPCIPLVDSAGKTKPEKRIVKVLGDGAYDRRHIFNEFEKRDIESGVKIRSNASRQSNGSPYRAECAREQQDKGYKPWSKEVGYGKRWAVEGVFSAVKRIFGESVKSTSIQGMYHEVMQKYCIYNILINI